MPDSDAVAAALARLVTGRAPAATSTSPPVPPSGPTSRSPVQVVEEAEAALTDLPTAAAFVVAGGEGRLRDAIDDAADDRVQERGREVLAALQRLRSAAEAGPPGGSNEPRHVDADHFHRGHTTLLKGGGVSLER